MRWLWAAVLTCAAAGAWRPPASLLVTPAHLRTRRSLPDAIHYQLLGWQLELKQNTAIRSHYKECQFYKGRILHEDDSSVTVTDCDGQLYGLLQAGGEEFVLEPTRKDNAHVLRRRDVVMEEEPVAYDLNGDTVTDLELDLEDESPRTHVRPRHNSRADIDYFRDILTVTRPVSGVQDLWLEMAIVADHTMLKFHSRDRVKHYILALMNIVSAIFSDVSLDTNVTLVINKLYLYEEKDAVIKYGNVKKTLEAVNKWNYRHLTKLPAGTTGWDAVVWLTRAQLGGPSGFAPVGGVCSQTRSGAIVRDEGLTSAFVIAHELGHLLGLTHDGESDCLMDPGESMRKSVMSPTVLATLHNYTWSNCSVQQFHEKSVKWWCLLERSTEEGVELGGASELSNYVFTMEEQCRSEFGEGFSVCKTVKVRSACSRLWCAHRAMPHVCKSKRAPPMEGTPCGRNHWCVKRACEPMPGYADNRVEYPEHARWEEWGEWSQCSADCGYGVRTRSRNCWFKGAISVSACEGAGSQVATCWSGSACASTRDMRTDICARQDRRLIPHVHPEESKQCELWCQDFGGGGAMKMGALPDGAPCSYQQQYDVCYQGTCVKGQCNSSDPICNWCPDGYCNNNTHFYIRHLNRGWTRMVVIPHEAHQLSVHMAVPVPLHIALRERKRERHILELDKHHLNRFEIEQNNYLKYDLHVPQNLRIVEKDSNVIDIKEGRNYGWEGQIVAAGTLLKWKQSDTDIFITATSRLQTDLMIMAIPETPQITEEIMVEVSVNYSTPAGRTRPLEFKWSTERGACSTSCGGGVRLVRPRCLRDDSCEPRYEPCNMHSCEFEWKTGEWEECSATCGTTGVQERQLFCLPANVRVSNRRDIIRNSVSPALCSDTKPDKHQPCNRIPCPVYWQEMPWTPCSTTCGRGISHRPLFCPASNEVLCGAKPRERRRRCRIRRCPPRRTSCPAADGTQYCELFTKEQLRRNCAIPPFKKYCCNACTRAEGEKDIG